MSLRHLTLSILLLVITQTLNAQVTGSFRSKQAGAWNDFNTWERYNGTAWVAAASTQYPDDPAVDVTIQAHTVLVTTTAPVPPYRMRNLTVESGGKLYTNINTTGGRYLGIYGTSLVCDGIIGNYPALDDIGFNIEGANVTISGSSAPTSFAATRIRKNFNASSGGVATTNLFINRSLYLTYNNGATNSTQLYNNITGTFNVTIPAGVTVNLTGSGNVSIDGTLGTDANSSRGTITVNGTLNIPGTLYLKTNNTGSPGNSVVIGPNGVVNTAMINAGASGSAGHSLILQENTMTGAGGKLNITGASAFTAFSTTNNIYNLGSIYTTVEYSATANQNVRNELTYAKLTLSGNGNKILLGNTTVNSNLLVNASALDVVATNQQLTLGGNLTFINGATTTTNALNYLTLTTIGTTNQLLSSVTPIQLYAMTSTKNSGLLTLSSGTFVRIKTDLILNYTGVAIFSDGGNVIQVGDDALFGSNASTFSNFNLTGKLHLTAEGTATSDYSTISDVGYTDASKAYLNNVLVDPMSTAVERQVYVMPLITTQLFTVKGNLVIANTAGLTQTSFWLNGNTLNLLGNLTTYDINGFQPGVGKVVLSGNTVQTLTSPNGFNFYQLEINNSLNTNLSTDIFIGNQLSLTNGLVVTDNYTVNIVSDQSAAIAGHSIASYIAGNLLRKVVAGSNYDFPVGTLQHYELANINLHTADGLDNLLVYFNSDLPATQPNPNVTQINGTPIADMLNAGYWTVLPDAYTSIDYDITLYERGFTNFTGAPVQLGVIKRENSSSPWWGTTNSGGPDGNQGTHDNLTQNIVNGTAVAKRSHLLSLSDFGIGFGNAALPVVLSAFTVSKNQDEVHLNWTTQSESQSHHFDVQRSADGFNFETIGTVKAEGNSAIETNYSFIDQTPLKGISYYRLAQVDIDGQTYLSSIRFIDIYDQETEQLTMYPIPAKDELIIGGLQADHEIQISDLTGRILISKTSTTSATSLNTSELTTGQYLIRITGKDSNLTRTFLIQ